MKGFFKAIVIAIIIGQTTTVSAFAIEKVLNLYDMEYSIYKHLENRDNKFLILYTGTRKEFEDNILNTISNAYSRDDYLERSWIEIKPHADITEDGIETTLDVTYFTNKKQEEYIDAQLQDITNSIIKANMSDLEKVRTIDDYIINRYEYDYTQKSISVYSALTTSLAICQGYSMTAYKMFNYAGIENRIIVGKIKGIPHSWNIVKIDGNWYHIDITNNDSIEKDKYFLVNDDYLIANQYSWNREKYQKSLKAYYNEN